MKTLRLIALTLLLALVITPLTFGQTTAMTTAQKVKLTVVPTPVGSIPAGTALVWSVDGSTPANVLGTFTPVVLPDGTIEPFTTWYLPVQAGTQVVRVNVTVSGTTYAASYTITVTLAPPSSIVIVAGTPIPK